MPARPPLRPDGPLNLAMAMLVSSSAPLLLLDDALNVVAVSTSFCLTFQIDPASAPGRQLFELGAGEWNVRQLRTLLSATASGDAAITGYEMDLKRDGRGTRRLVINAQKLDYEGDVRLLVSVLDLTDTRAAQKLKDNLLREKAILLQELQHRVANSLQIIASVLLQSARRVNSEETKGHLHDAHDRVMSVASLQRQLSSSSLSDVKLRGYLTRLGESIGASMIRDHTQLSLEVVCDDSVVSPDTSISLGLIVTELVINALKHAFPGGRGGKIVIDYHARGPNWTLSASDDGAGMPPDSESAKAGLGTSIVEALAKQLNARVNVSQANPGTTVSIVHSPVAAVTDEQAGGVV
jgi:two-component sensor histidine kinase